MNQITDPPNEYGFGMDFDYSVWTADTEITLCNVPWNNDYRDIVRFNDKAALNSYIDSSINTNIKVDKLKYTPVNRPIQISTPFNRVARFNYLRASNPIQPVPGSDMRQDFYYFITDVRYVAPNNTEIIVQLDVWQTYGDRVKFGQCYVERGHISLANSKNFDNYGRDYLTVPEGMDVGGEYQVIAKRNQRIMQSWNNTTNKEQQYNILVATTIDFQADPGTEDKPRMSTAKGGAYFGLPSGADYWVFEDAQAFSLFLDAFQDKPWVTQGIISITVIPSIRRYQPNFQYATLDNPLHGVKAPLSNLLPKRYGMFTNWRNNAEIRDKIPARYRNLRKFFTYPYMAIELTTFSGTPVILKPESWNHDHAYLTERVSMVPPQQRLHFSPEQYNARVVDNIESIYPDIDPGNQIGLGDDGGEYLDVATQITAFPALAIVNNGAILYMANNANTIPYQHQSAEWSQQKALRGADNAYAQAQESIGGNYRSALYNRTADTASTNLSAANAMDQWVAGGAGSMGQGGLGGLVGGPAGAAAGAGMAAAQHATGFLGTQLNQQHIQDQLGVRNRNSIRQTDNSNEVSRYMAETNQAFARYAARGDYMNQIQGINARVRDAQLTPPSTVGQVGGEAMNLLNNNVMVSVRWKMIDLANIRAIGEFWLRYGYAVQQFVTPPESLRVMSKFTYWKMSETYITAANMPEGFKLTIRGIFEKGVTVWSNPNEIGQVDMASNTPLAGVTLP